VSTRYAIGNNFLGNLISLVIRYKPKSIHLNRHDLSRLKFTLLSSIDPQIRLDSTGTKIIVKTGNSIRNPKDFDLFIETYIESTLSLNNSLPGGTVLFPTNYAPGEYVEEAIRNYAEGELQSQAFLTITTQGTYEEVTIESQSGPSFVSLKSQSNESIQTQSYQPIEMPTYTYEARVPISDSSGKSLTSSFYNRTNLMPILAKGAAITSYTRTYTA
jgi:hypothetical protein